MAMRSQRGSETWLPAAYPDQVAAGYAPEVLEWRMFLSVNRAHDAATCARFPWAVGEIAAFSSIRSTACSVRRTGIRIGGKNLSSPPPERIEQEGRPEATAAATAAVAGRTLPAAAMVPALGVIG